MAYHTHPSPYSPKKNEIKKVRSKKSDCTTYIYPNKGNFLYSKIPHQKSQSFLGLDLEVSVKLDKPKNYYLKKKKKNSPL